MKRLSPTRKHSDPREWPGVDMASTPGASVASALIWSSTERMSTWGQWSGPWMSAACITRVIEGHRAFHSLWSATSSMCVKSIRSGAPPQRRSTCVWQHNQSNPKKGFWSRRRRDHDVDRPGGGISWLDKAASAHKPSTLSPASTRSRFGSRPALDGRAELRVVARRVDDDVQVACDQRMRRSHAARSASWPGRAERTRRGRATRRGRVAVTPCKEDASGHDGGHSNAVARPGARATTSRRSSWASGTRGGRRRARLPRETRRAPRPGRRRAATPLPEPCRRGSTPSGTPAPP